MHRVSCIRAGCFSLFVLCLPERSAALVARRSRSISDHVRVRWRWALAQSHLARCTRNNERVLSPRQAFDRIACVRSRKRISGGAHCDGARLYASTRYRVPCSAPKLITVICAGAHKTTTTTRQTNQPTDQTTHTLIPSIRVHRALTHKCGRTKLNHLSAFGCLTHSHATALPPPPTTQPTPACRRSLLC